VDRAKAKREACWLAAEFLSDNMISIGWPRTPSHEEDYSEAEFERIEAGLNELVEELRRRGHAS
jgi:hypothetical protein